MSSRSRSGPTLLRPTRRCHQGLTPDPKSAGHALGLFVDWQFTARDDEYLDPARYQYREFYLLLDAMYHYFPRLTAGRHDDPAVNELVMAVTDDLKAVGVWSGEADFKFPATHGEERHALARSAWAPGIGFRCPAPLAT